MPARVGSVSGGVVVRIYVSSDIEGVAGVVAVEQTMPSGGGEYARGRSLMTDEVNAAIAAAFACGASEVLVNDAHGPNTNLLVERLVGELVVATSEHDRHARRGRSCRRSTSSR
jgi:D-aminopeptidase